MGTALDNLKQHSTQITGLHHILALLQWDQEVRMPRRAAAGRAEQFAALSAMVHQKEVDPLVGKWLHEAEEQGDTLATADRALVRVLRRSYDQNTRLPERFVADFSRLTSQAQGVWVAARQQSDFERFRPLLEQLVAMSRQKADYLGFEAHPYDALLDLHEEGLTTARVERMFAEIREPVRKFVREAGRQAQPEFLFQEPFARERQVALSERLLRRIGFDFERGCLALSPHPFTAALGHHDRRVTNRYQPYSLEFLFSALHEGGHALYEQGIAEELAQSHLDTGVSLGIHESQSRLWENIIGRGRPFWQGFYPELREAFPAQLAAVSLDDFIGAINAVRPGPIRVEADEVTYNLHVLIRFELEKALLEAEIEVKALPALWNEKYRQYLDVKVDTDANGVLQDIHWAHGSLGYFPTYTIGNLAAAQIWEAYKRFDPDHEETLRCGNLEKIRSWLTQRIYRHGSVYPPRELLKRVTGEELRASYFLRYLEKKQACSPA